MHRVRQDDLPNGGSSHSAIGQAPLVQLDVHLSPRFIQENVQE
jgi:hypothetical protein